jgi:Rrf2 family iron-sulfur cluster assembly transcriptional regulator
LISTTSQYALRALGCLASQPPDQVVLGRDLAESAGVPANYLSKILLLLKREGVVQATRGPSGGYKLSRPSADIKLIEIIEPIDRVSRLDECLMGMHKCSEEDPCGMHDWWKRVRDDYLEMLRHTSLADVIRIQDRSEQD